MTNPVYTWRGQVAKGARGQAQIMDLLRAQGKTVIDLSDLPDARMRDIDLLVNGKYVEVKSDYHTPEKIFLEITCDDKPGCVFKSKADEWLYGFPEHGIWYEFSVARLQWFCVRHIGDYPLKSITSVRGGRQWVASGIVVPLDALLVDAVGQRFLVGTE